MTYASATRRPWIAPLAAIVVLFVGFSLPPYLSFDPARSRVPAPAGFPHYFAMLSAHVVFGSVAILSVCLQIWPRFRARHPVAHRNVGRLYVFGGVLPAALLALPMAAFSPFGPVARASSLMLVSLWLGVTLTGFWKARQRRFVEHRRWMIRSFALTASIMTNRIWGALGFLFFAPKLASTFGGNEIWLSWTVAGLATWLGWVIPWLAAEWWLERKPS